MTKVSIVRFEKNILLIEESHIKSTQYLLTLCRTDKQTRDVIYTSDRLVDSLRTVLIKCDCRAWGLRLYSRFRQSIRYEKLLVLPLQEIKAIMLFNKKDKNIFVMYCRRFPILANLQRK